MTTGEYGVLGGDKSPPILFLLWSYMKSLKLNKLSRNVLASDGAAVNFSTDFDDGIPCLYMSTIYGDNLFTAKQKLYFESEDAEKNMIDACNIKMADSIREMSKTLR